MHTITRKNIVLSVILTVIMVFSMIPLSVFAAESNVAEVTVNGTTTRYATLTDAIDEAIRTLFNDKVDLIQEGTEVEADIKLLRQFSENVVVDSDLPLININIILGDDEGDPSETPYWTAQDDGVPLTAESGGVTLRGGSISADANSAIVMNGGILTIAGSVTEIKGGEDAAGYQYPAINAKDGELVLQGNTILDGGLSVGNYAKVKGGLKGGIFTNSVDSAARISLADYSSYPSVFDLLAPGYLFAEYNKDTGETGDFIAKDATVKSLTKDVIVVKCPAHTDTDNDGNCDVCGASFVAQAGGNYYVTLTEAIAKANGEDITVLAVEPHGFGENVVVENGATANIILGDLFKNNEEDRVYRWRGLDYGIPLTMKGGNITLKDGVMANANSGPDADSAILLEDGTLTIAGDTTKIIGALGVNRKPAIKATGGTLVLKDNVTLYGGLEMSGDATVKDGLKAGIFINDDSAARVSVEGHNTYKSVFDLLAPGYVFAKYENGKAGDIVGYSEYELTEDVIVIACTHKDSSGNSLFMYGECAECGFTCMQHTLDDNGTCEICGEKFAAKDDKGNLYDSLENALWEVAPGGTVTVLADLSESVGFNAENKNVTLNLDGHSLTGSGFATLQVDDGLLTVINGVAGSATADEPIRISHAESNGIAIDVSDGELTLGSKLEANAEVSVNGGKITFEKAATFNAGLWFRFACNGSTLPIGSIVKNSGDDDRISVHDGTVFDLLPENCVFAEYKSDGSTGNIIKKDATTWLNVDVIVVAHPTHKLDADGKCACGYGCPHESDSREASYFRKAICANCGAEHGDVLKDETAPTGKIAINGSYPSEKLFSTEEVTVTIEAEDDSYTHDGYDATKHAVKIEYLINTWTLPAGDLPNKTFTPYGGAIKLSDEKDHVIYVRLTDHAGNVVYINSEVTIDSTAPTINGKTDGATVVRCGEDVKVEISDGSTVLVDGVDTVVLGGNITLDAGSGDHTVTAIDRAGNRTTVTFRMYDAHDFDPETGLCKHACGATAAIKAELTDGTTKAYGSLADAAADMAAVRTLTLLKNIVASDVEVTVKNNLTIDLNGHNLLCQALTVKPDAGKTCTLTVTGEGHVMTLIYVFSGGRLVVNNTVTRVDSLMVTSTDGTAPTDWSVQLKGGTYGSIDLSYQDADGNTQPVGRLVDLLPPGYVFDQNVYDERLAQNVTVSPCADHDWKNGKCTICRLVCEHNWSNNAETRTATCATCSMTCVHDDEDLIEQRDGKIYCSGTCKQQMLVKVVNEDFRTGYTHYYPKTTEPDGVDRTLKDVFNNAESGSTITLLTDGLLAFAAVQDGKTITLDLNGKQLVEHQGITAGSDSNPTTADKLIVVGTAVESSQLENYIGTPCTFLVDGGTLELGNSENSLFGTISSVHVKDGKVTTPENSDVRVRKLIINTPVDDVDTVFALEGGYFDEISLGSNYYDGGNRSVTLGHLLKENAGRAFQGFGGDGKELLAYNTQIENGIPITGVAIAPCDHSSLTTGCNCEYCGYQNIVAVVVTPDGSITTFAAESNTADKVSEKVHDAFTLLNDGVGGTMTFYMDAALTKDYTIESDKNVVIDLNGHRISGGKTLTRTTAGTLRTLTITDSSRDKTGSFENNIVIENNIILTVDGVKVGNVTILSGATFTANIGSSFAGIEAADENTIFNSLPNNCAFEGADGTIVDARTKSLTNVTVVPHSTHTYAWNTDTHELACACGDVKETDTTAPILDGIENDETYYGEATFTVADKNLDTVTVDGESVEPTDGKYTIIADNGQHTVVVTDKAGNSTTVTVAVNEIYNVTFVSGVGYTVDGTLTVGYGQKYEFTVRIAEGYSKTDDYRVLVNGEEISPAFDDNYTCNAYGDMTITVVGVADITAPEEVEIKIGKNSFKSFRNSRTFDLFFKGTQTVTVTAKDFGSGVKTVEYLLSETAFDKEANVTGDWKTVNFKDGTGSFSIAPNAKCFVYVRVTDADGNATVINSAGMVVYTDSKADIRVVYFDRLSDEEITFNVTLNGNTVKSLTCDGTVIDSKNYTVAGGTVTLHNAFLRTLAADQHFITVDYNPMGETYAAADGNAAPTSSVITLQVRRLVPELEFSAPNAVYDGAVYDDLSITDKPEGTVIKYKIKGAADDTYTTTAPKNAGSYTVQITTPQDENYYEWSFTADFDITPKEVTITGTTAKSTKVYDGSTAAEIESNGTLSGVLDGDVLSIVKGKANYDNKNVGTGKTVTFTDFAIDGADKGNYVLKAQPASVKADITPKEVTITGATVKSTKIYDGSTVAEIENEGTLNGVEDGDTLTIVKGNANYDNKNVGTAKTVTFSAFGLDGADKGNYVLKAQPASVTADITPKEVTITGTTVKSTKVYDGNTVAEIESNGTLNGVKDGDKLSIVKGNANYDNKNVGTGKTVTFTDFAIDGADKGNYVLKAQPTSVKAGITPKEVTVTGTSVESTKVYDGKDIAEITDNGTLSGVVNGDDLRIVIGKANYDNKNVGTAKTVTFSAFGLDGTDKGNYVLKAQPASVKADITPKEVTITDTSVESTKVYDGKDIAEITDNGTLSGVLEGDDLQIVIGKANYDNKNVGTEKTVTFSEFGLDGTDKGNYVLKAQPASVTADITPKELTIKDLKIKTKQYDGTNKAEFDGIPALNGVVDGDTLTLTNGTPIFDSTAEGKNIAISFTTPFALAGDEVTVKNYTLTQPSGITADIVAWLATGSEYAVNSNDWINTDFAVTAKDGYQISLTNTANGTWTSKLTAANETADGKLTFYVKNTATGVISSAVIESYKIDKTAPTGTLTINESNSFQKFLNTITFAVFYKDDVTVKLSADDDASDVKSVAYYKSDKALTLEQVKAVTDWTQYSSFCITANDKAQFVVYARIEDNAGNVTYLSSDGAEFDLTAPEIIGVENNDVYYVTRRVIIDDLNLKSVTLNGKPVNIDTPFDLIGDKDATYTIVATDQAGNMTEYIVIMKPLSAITDTINDITTENVKSDDAERIEIIAKQILDIAAESDEEVIGDEQWNKLLEASQNCKKLATRIAEAAADMTRLTDSINAYGNVTSSDNADIEGAIADITTLLDSNNLTDTERTLLIALKKNAQSLLDLIAAAKATAESDEILAIEKIAKDNVTLDEKDALEKAEKALEDAQKDFGDNYTEEERESLKVKLDTVKAALDAISNAEKAAEEIEKLPSADKVKLTDKDEVERVKELVDALTENEKTMLGEESVDKVVALNEKLAELAADASEPTSPSTGDTANIVLWIALLFISGGVITGVVLLCKKKKQ